MIRNRLMKTLLIRYILNFTHKLILTRNGGAA